MFGRTATPVAVLGALIWLLGAAPAQAGAVCGDEICELLETCENCAVDCGVCPTVTLPDSSTTTTMLDSSTTTTLPTGACCSPNGSCSEGIEQSCEGIYQGDNSTCEFTICDPPVTVVDSTSTTVQDTTTTTVADSTTTTIPTGACCTFGSCLDLLEENCVAGTFQGVGTSCSDPGVCVNCGDGCLDFGETCDDLNTDPGDGCSATCQEERCWTCSGIQPDSDVALNGFTGSTAGPVGCIPSQCTEVVSVECEVCGDGETGPGEECDDANSVGGDCCSSTCQYESEGSPCDNGIFCDGDAADLCDGAGTCDPGSSPPPCPPFNSPCAAGFCNTQTDACDVDTDSFNGLDCDASAECIVDNTGQCQDGICTGTGTVLSPSCRWIILAGYEANDQNGNIDPSKRKDVKVRTGRSSTAEDSICGDGMRIGGENTGSLVSILQMGDPAPGIKFEASAAVDGDVVTKKSSLASTLYGHLPGSTSKSLEPNKVEAKLPSGVFDTTGNHPLVNVCDEDQRELADAADVLDGLDVDLERAPIATKLAGVDEVNATGKGVYVVKVQRVRLTRKSTLTIRGGASDVAIIRIDGGPFMLGYGARIDLQGGITADRVLFYSNHRTCRMSPGSSGSGTVFCKNATKFRIGTGVDWSGSFLGGANEIRVRLGATLAHVPFTGL